MGILFQEHSLKAVHGRSGKILNMTPEELDKIKEKKQTNIVIQQMANNKFIRELSERAVKSETALVAERSQKNSQITFRGLKNEVPVSRKTTEILDLSNIEADSTPEIKNTDYNKVRPLVDSLESMEMGNNIGIIREEFDIVNRKKQHKKSHPYGTGVSFDGEKSMNNGFRITHRASVPRIENKDKYHILKVLPKVHNPINNDKLVPPGFTSKLQLYEVKNSGLANVRKKINGPVYDTIDQAQAYTNIINFANTDKQAHTVHSKMQSSVIFVPEAGFGTHRIDEWELNSRGKGKGNDSLRDIENWMID